MNLCSALLRFCISGDNSGHAFYSCKEFEKVWVQIFDSGIGIPSIDMVLQKETISRKMLIADFYNISRSLASGIWIACLHPLANTQQGVFKL